MNNQLVSDTTHPRVLGRKDRDARAYVIFSGWGPKMMALAIAASAVASSTGRSDAAVVSTQHGLCTLGMAPPILAETQPKGWPNDYTEAAASGIVTLRVTVDSSAHVTRSAIEKSSGDFALDQDARRLMSEAKLAPSDESCKTQPGDYAFVIDYREPGQ